MFYIKKNKKIKNKKKKELREIYYQRNSKRNLGKLRN